MNLGLLESVMKQEHLRILKDAVGESLIGVSSNNNGGIWLATVVKPNGGFIEKQVNIFFNWEEAEELKDLLIKKLAKRKERQIELSKTKIKLAD